MAHQRPITAAASPPAALGPLTPDEAWQWLASLAAQLAALHGSGKLHGAVGIENISRDESGRPCLSAPAEQVEFKSGTDIERCPPELQGKQLGQLPTLLAAARERLSRAGMAVDPRRIDVYQLGALICRLSSQAGVAAYLRSAKARALVSPKLRPLVDRALGYDAAARFADCRQLAEAVQAAEEASAAAESETPALGIFDPAPGSTPPTGHRPATAGHDDALSAEIPFERLGAYRILQRIGGGGMGDVFQAVDEGLQRMVAVKVLPPELARHPDFVRRFRAEATAVARLVHPNVVQVFACGEDAGRHYFAMQFVQGQSLAGLLAGRGRLSVDETLPIITQCLAGLAAAHRQGLIHRDIKPGNILLDHDHGRALVADFGLVKTVDSGENLTATGVIMGTVDYIPPEQARGLKVDSRSDLYSVGALMYRMLSGRLPFEADSPTGMIFQHAFEQPVPLQDAAPEVPEVLAAIVMRLLAKYPKDRYQSAEELIEAIEAFRAGKPLAQPEPASAPLPAGELTGSGEPALAASWAPPIVQRRGWRTQLWTAFHAHAPAAVKELLDTQHQMDGAVFEYQQRRDQLALLVRQAQQVAGEFEAQARQHRQAAAEAAQRAASAADPETAAEAQRQQAELARVADDFTGQASEQQDQLQDLRLQFAKVNARLEQLRSQRDILQARLKTAQAELGVNALRPGLPRTKVIVIVFSLLLLAPLAIVFLAKARSVGTNTAIEGEMAERAANVSERMLAIWAVQAGGTARLDNGPGGNVEVTNAAAVDALFRAAEKRGTQPRVMTISLRNTWHKDHELGPLAKARNVRRLELQDTPTGDLALSYIALMRSLEFLDLSGTQVTAEGVARLQAALPQCKIVGSTATAAPASPARTSLIGRVIVNQQDIGLVVRYAAGRLLKGSAIQQYVLQRDGEMKGVRLSLQGTLELPRPMRVGVWHKGGTPSDGVHYVFVDGRELGSVGDDRTKDAAYSIFLSAGTHSVDWLLTGGDLGDDNLVEFFDPATRQPLPLIASAADLSAAEAKPALARLDNLTMLPQKNLPLLPDPIPATVHRSVAPRGTSLLGRVQVKGQDIGLVVRYATGARLKGATIVQYILEHGHEIHGVNLDLNGTLHVPRDMRVEIWHRGGTADQGIHYLFVDGNEVGSVGDDRTKNTTFSLSLAKGDHAIRWRLTGGALGDDNLVQFIDRETGEPLKVSVAAAELAAAEAGPILAELNYLALDEQDQKSLFASPTAPIPFTDAAPFSLAPTWPARNADGFSGLAGLVDPTRDQLDASWKLTGDAVEFSAHKPRAYVSIPLSIKGDYELAARITILRAKETTALYLPIGATKAVVIELRGDDGNTESPTATTHVVGFKPAPRPQLGTTIRVGVEYAYLCRMVVDETTADMTVHRDGQLLYHWSGPLLKVADKNIRPGTIGFRTAYYSIARIRGLQLKMLSGQATPLNTQLLEVR